VAGAILCLPTYEERENLARMVDAVDAVRAASPDLDVLVIDDGSPDGTGEIADELALTRPWLHVLHRTAKEGLGRAYLAGFAWALEREYDQVLEMDCDFSHDPARIPALRAAVANGADVALGSRYVAGGGVCDWGLARRIISRGGCLYAQVILQLPVHDLTGGFKCFDRRVLEAISLADVGAEGYAFQIEMTYRARLLGFTVVEVPIIFSDRVRGGSKMSRRIVAEAAWRVPQLRWRALRGRIPRHG
jgi:dolichol-phosphate mannosyltransferase